MKGKYMFGQISFLIICGLLVSFSFVREFGTEASMFSVREYSLNDNEAAIPNSSIVDVKFFDCEDQLVYQTKVDLNDATRKKDELFMNYLRQSEFIKKGDHTISFRLSK